MAELAIPVPATAQKRHGPLVGFVVRLFREKPLG